MAKRALNSDGSHKYQTVTGHGLGYYVHYHNENYRQFGINFNKTGGVSASDALNETHARLLTHLKKNKVSGDVKSFEQFLNMMAQADSEGLENEFGVSKEDYENAEKAVYDRIEQEFPQFRYNWNNLDLESALDGSKQYTYKSKKKDDRKYIQIRSIGKLIGAINKSLNEIKNYLKTKKGILSVIELNEINQKRKQLEAAKQQLIALKKENRSTKSIMLTKERKEEIWQIIKEANDALASIILPTKEQQGWAAELTWGVTLASLLYKTDKVTDQMLEPIMQGKKLVKNTPVVRKGGFFAMEALRQDMNRGFGNVTSPEKERFQMSDGGIIDVMGSYDTADLIMQLPDENEKLQELGLNGLGASLKNYSNIDGYYGVDIVSGVSLLTALNFVTVNFANHYLNLFALGRSNYAQSPYYDEIKRALVVRGLLGLRDIYNPNSTTNQLFIVHNKGGKLGNIYKAFDASELTQKYWKDIENVNVTNLPDKAVFPNGWVKNNDFVAGAMGRITNMLRYVHTIKLTVSLHQLSSY